MIFFNLILFIVCSLGTFTDATMKTMTGFIESPDSGIPPSPERSNKSGTELLSGVGSQNEYLDMNISSEISKKLNGVMEKNARALNEVWVSKISSGFLR